MTFPTAFENLNVLSQQTLLPPSALHDAVPATRARQPDREQRARHGGQHPEGQDTRLLVVVGPCSFTTSAPPKSTPSASKRWPTS